MLQCSGTRLTILLFTWHLALYYGLATFTKVKFVNDHHAPCIQCLDTTLRLRNCRVNGELGSQMHKKDTNYSVSGDATK